MYAVITLSNIGADVTGPFNMWADADGFTAAFETNVTLAALLSGFVTNSVPIGSTIIRIRGLAPSSCKEFFVDTNI